jgi:hypothetical protein
MKKWILAGVVVTVVAFMAEPVSAQEAIKAPATITSSSGSSSEPMYMPAQRRGLFGRRRGGSTMVYQSTPTTSGTVMTSRTGTMTTTSPSGIQQAQFTTPATTTPSTTTPATTETLPNSPMTTTSDMRPVEYRQGLLGRLRARRGR